jgi:hypothetical protein
MRDSEIVAQIRSASETIRSSRAHLCRVHAKLSYAKLSIRHALQMIEDAGQVLQNPDAPIIDDTPTRIMGRRHRCY